MEEERVQLHVESSNGNKCALTENFKISPERKTLRNSLGNGKTKTKMGYISLPSVLNAIIGITSYYCVILKLLILHDGMKTIQNWLFPFSL